MDHPTVWSWVQRRAPEINKRVRPQLKMSGTSYPEAFSASVKEKLLPFDCKLRRVEHLNNVMGQDHRAIRRRWRAWQCFRNFHAAERMMEGVEARRVTRKGQVKRLSGSDPVGQAEFVESLFDVAAEGLERFTTSPASNQSLRQNP